MEILIVLSLRVILNDLYILLYFVFYTSNPYLRVCVCFLENLVNKKFVARRH